MIDVKVELSDKEVQEYLVKTEKEIANVKKPLAKSLIYMIGSIKRNFVQQGRPVKWQKLSPLTIALRRKGKGRGSPQILRDTGILMNSITGEIKDEGNNAVAIAGTSLDYAPKLQFGGFTKTPEMTIVPKRKKALRFMYRGKEVFTKRAHIPSRITHIPSRPFVMFQLPEDADRIQRIFDKHVDEAIK